MIKELDIDTPEGARKYISYAADNLLLGNNINFVRMSSGEEIHFNNMDDEQAIRVAKALYFDIEIPAASMAKKQ